MFSKQYQGYAFVGLILIAWSVLIDTRNVNNPQVQHVTVQKQGSYSVVNCEVWNPRYEAVYVKTLVRLLNPGDPNAGRPVTVSPYNVVKHRIAARSSLPIHERIKAYGVWPEAEVRVFVINDQAEINKIAADSTLTNPQVQ
jgi:hypothetical protein